MLYCRHVTRLELLNRNPRLLFWAKVCVNFKTLNAIITLFYLHRGLSIAEIVWLSGLFGAVSLVAEVPSGYMADAFGRKRTMLLGVLFMLAATAIHWFATDFAWFAAAFVLLSFSFSCFSGTEEALLYDTLKETGREKDMLRFNSRLLSAGNLAKIFLPSLGAIIAADLSETHFQWLIAADAFGLVAALVLLARIVEPAHEADVSARETGIFRESVRTIVRRPSLFIASMNKILPFVASILVWRVYQPYFLERGIPALWLGLFYVVIHSAMFALKWLSEAIETRFGARRVLDATVLLMAAFIVAAAFVRSAVPLFVAVGLFFVSHNIREPMYAHWINAHIRSRSRATTLSNLAVFRSAIDVPVMYAGGLLAAIDTRLAFALAAGLCLSVLVFFRIREEDVVDV